MRDGYLRELALAISLVSLGSSQTFFLPQRRTLEASLFWSRSILRRTTDTAQHHGSFPRPDGAFAAGLQAAGRAAANSTTGKRPKAIGPENSEAKPRSAVPSLGLPSARTPAAISPPPQRAAQPPFSPEA